MILAPEAYLIIAIIIGSMFIATVAGLFACMRSSQISRREEAQDGRR